VKNAFSKTRDGAAAITLLLTFFLIPGVSWGHAFPDHADPKVGAAISGSPALVRIWFDSALEPAFSRITVQNGGGKRVDKGDGRVNATDPTLLETGVPALPPGTYLVIWDVVARDGHRTTGDYRFTVK
jgi:methionine-rich copper-binding protein CopC